jgi:hypothetical protein
VDTAGSDHGSHVPALTRQQSSQLVRWLRDNTRKGAVIAVAADLSPLLDAALADREVITVEDDRSPSADLVVVPHGWPGAPHALVVADLKTRTGAVDVLQPLVATSTLHEQRARRVEAGRRLVKSVDLRLTPRAWAMLTHGEVDLAAVMLLRRLLASHRIDVSSFRSDRLAAAAGAPARSVNISAVDGATPDADLMARMRVPGARTHLGRDRGRPTLVADVPVAGQG